MVKIQILTSTYLLEQSLLTRLPRFTSYQYCHSVAPTSLEL